MNVIIISYEYPPFGGGAGVVAQQNASSIEKAGGKVKLVINGNAEAHESWKLNIFTVMLIALTYRFLKVDYILLNDVRSIHYAGLFFSKSLLNKCVAFIHGSEPEGIYESPSMIKRVAFFDKFYTRAIRKCYRVVSPSHYMKEKFINRTPCAIPESKINVLYAGVDLSTFTKLDKFKVRREHGFLENDLIFLTVSRVVEGKGFKRKILIFIDILKINPSAKWIIVGQGDYEDELRRMIKELSLEEQVFLVGYVNRRELSLYYSLADIFWLLSEFEESFGLVYLEAQCFGLYTIGNDKGGVKEAISAASGALVNTDSDVLNLIKRERFRCTESSEFNRFIGRLMSVSIYDYLYSIRAAG